MSWMLAHCSARVAVGFAFNARYLTDFPHISGAIYAPALRVRVGVGVAGCGYAEEVEDLLLHGWRSSWRVTSANISESVRPMGTGRSVVRG